LFGCFVGANIIILNGESEKRTKLFFKPIADGRLRNKLIKNDVVIKILLLYLWTEIQKLRV
jgi:hypothetical protein